MRKFIIQTNAISNAQQVQSQNSNAIIFTNLSDGIVYVENVPIPAYVVGMQEYPTLIYSGLDGEILLGSFNVKMGTSLTPLVLITRKTYSN